MYTTRENKTQIWPVLFLLGMGGFWTWYAPAVWNWLTCFIGTWHVPGLRG